MPVEGLASRYRELGRLKFGEDLGDRPAQLKTWRLVSPSAELIEAAGQLYGGRLTYTDAGAELVTDTADLEVILPAQDVAGGQWFELWTAGGLQRRCSGLATVDVTHDGTWTETGPCQCDPAARDCRLRTVLRVILPQLPDLGVWRLSTGSTYAAAELPTTAAAILSLAGSDFAPAVLGLEERTSKKPGQPAKPYIVPVLRTRATVAAMLENRADPAPAVLEAPAARQIGPATIPEPAATAPEHPPEAPEPARGSPDTPTPRKPANPALLEAARFLASTPPPDTAARLDELVDTLDALELVMVAAKLWKPGAIDAAAHKADLHPEWRNAGTTTPRVRTLTIRAVLAANKALEDHPDGYQAAQTARREKTP